MKQLGRKSLALLTALVMVATLCILPAAAEEADPEGGPIVEVTIEDRTETYNDLVAFSAALTEQTGEVGIKLLKNITLPSGTITVGKNQIVVLDMNSHSIAVPDTYEGRPITNEGSLTVTGDGTIDTSMSQSGGYGAINNKGTLVIENGTYRGAIYAEGSVIRNTGADAVLTIEDGTFEKATCAIFNEGTAVINGGTFKGETCSSCNKDIWSYTIRNYAESARMTINGGTFIGTQGAVSASVGELEINNGTFKTVDCSQHHGAIFYALYAAGEVGKVKCVINGGSFETAGKYTAVLVGNDGDGGIGAQATAYVRGGIFKAPNGVPALKGATETGDPIITGGTFSSDVSAYVADGYSGVKNGDNYVINGPVAAIGDVKYATLAEAVEAVQENDTLAILEGTYDEPLIINRGVKNLTICGAGVGKTVLTGGMIMSTDQPKPDSPARNIDGLTIKDIDFQGKGITFVAWWENGSLSDITIQNNRFSNIQDEGNAAIHLNLDTKLAVENVTILDNIIDGVGTGNTTPSGIYISAAKGDVRIENNIIRNTNHSSIQLFNQSMGTLSIQNNRLEHWDRDQAGGGRAFRFENLSKDITSAVIRNNCMVPVENFSGEDTDIFKLSGTELVNVDATRNYWGTATPNFAVLVTGETVKTDPWYKAETMRDQDLSNYVPSGSSGSSSGTTTKPTVDTDTKTEGDVKTETVTETVKNKDGSTTINVTEKAENAATGETTETKATETVAKDGSVTKEEVKTTTAADGTRTEEKNVAISDKATGTETTAQVVTDGTGRTVATAKTEAKPEAAVKDGAATAAVDQKGAEKLVEQAKAAAEAAKDADRVEAVVVLTAQVPEHETVTAVSVEVPKAAVESLAKETAAAVVVSTPIADVTLPNGALESLAGQKGETVAVKAEKTEDGGVKVSVTVGDQAVETVRGGLKASLPAEAAAPGTVAVLVHADGTEEIIRKSVVTGGTAVVPLDGSATIKLVDNGKNFPDTADHWAGEAVEFVTARGLFQGVSDDSFAPGAEMTRGMLVTVLDRLENEPETEGTLAFPDVTGDAYYAGAVAWAAETGIVTGTGAGFDPEAPITRQTLATILYRYLGTQGADLSVRGDLSAYADGDAVDGWAQDAMAYAVGAGLMTGKDGQALDPTGTATRAEVAIVLQRMVEGMA